ncbi:MAG: hypothetical protein WBA09_13210, partial [Candidatus Acidiferrum sp.]
LTRRSTARRFSAPLIHLAQLRTGETYPMRSHLRDLSRGKLCVFQQPRTLFNLPPRPFERRNPLTYYKQTPY